MSIPLKAFRSNVFSQNGEDGVLEELIKRLKVTSIHGQCVEFGAWDGIHFSNTFNLVRNHGWKALYIEGNLGKYQQLVKTAQDYPNIIPVNSWISFEPNSDSSIDQVLKKNQIPYDFDILSIDIDSYDLEVWMSMMHFSPKVVVIEINSTYPPGVRQTHSDSLQGASFTSTLEVGLEKGYRLVLHTGNMIFVKSEFVSLLNIHKEFLLNPELLFDWSWIQKKKQSRRFFPKRS